MTDLPDPADCFACQTAGTRLCDDHADAAWWDEGERTRDLEEWR